MNILRFFKAKTAAHGKPPGAQFWHQDVNWLGKPGLPSWVDPNHPETGSVVTHGKKKYLIHGKHPETGTRVGTLEDPSAGDDHGKAFMLHGNKAVSVAHFLNQQKNVQNSSSDTTNNAPINNTSTSVAPPNIPTPEPEPVEPASEPIMGFGSGSHHPADHYGIHENVHPTHRWFLGNYGDSIIHGDDKSLLPVPASAPKHKTVNNTNYHIVGETSHHHLIGSSTDKDTYGQLFRIYDDHVKPYVNNTAQVNHNHHVYALHNGNSAIGLPSEIKHNENTGNLTTFTNNHGSVNKFVVLGNGTGNDNKTTYYTTHQPGDVKHNSIYFSKNGEYPKIYKQETENIELHQPSTPFYTDSAYGDHMGIPDGVDTTTADAGTFHTYNTIHGPSKFFVYGKLANGNILAAKANHHSTSDFGELYTIHNGNATHYVHNVGNQNSAPEPSEQSASQDQENSWPSDYHFYTSSGDKVYAKPKSLVPTDDAGTSVHAPYMGMGTNPNGKFTILGKLEDGTKLAVLDSPNSHYHGKIYEMDGDTPIPVFLSSEEVPESAAQNTNTAVDNASTQEQENTNTPEEPVKLLEEKKPDVVIPVQSNGKQNWGHGKPPGSDIWHIQAGAYKGMPGPPPDLTVHPSHGEQLTAKVPGLGSMQFTLLHKLADGTDIAAIHSDNQEMNGKVFKINNGKAIVYQHDYKNKTPEQYNFKADEPEHGIHIENLPEPAKDFEKRISSIYNAYKNDANAHINTTNKLVTGSAAKILAQSILSGELSPYLHDYYKKELEKYCPGLSIQNIANNQSNSINLFNTHIGPAIQNRVETESNPQQLPQDEKYSYLNANGYPVEGNLPSILPLNADMPKNSFFHGNHDNPIEYMGKNPVSGNFVVKTQNNKLKEISNDHLADFRYTHKIADAAAMQDIPNPEQYTTQNPSTMEHEPYNPEGIIYHPAQGKVLHKIDANGNIKESHFIVGKHAAFGYTMGALHKPGSQDHGNIESVEDFGSAAQFHFHPSSPVDWKIPLKDLRSGGGLPHGIFASPSTGLLETHNGITYQGLGIDSKNRDIVFDTENGDVSAIDASGNATQYIPSQEEPLNPHIYMPWKHTVQHPGAHGATHWYYDGHGNVVYGDPPTTPISSQPLATHTDDKGVQFNKISHSNVHPKDNLWSVNAPGTLTHGQLHNFVPGTGFVPYTHNNIENNNEPEEENTPLQPFSEDQLQNMGANAEKADTTQKEEEKPSVIPNADSMWYYDGTGKTVTGLPKGATVSSDAGKEVNRKYGILPWKMKVVGELDGRRILERTDTDAKHRIYIDHTGNINEDGYIHPFIGPATQVKSNNTPLSDAAKHTYLSENNSPVQGDPPGIIDHADTGKTIQKTIQGVQYNFKVVGIDPATNNVILAHIPSVDYDQAHHKLYKETPDGAISLYKHTPQLADDSLSALPGKELLPKPPGLDKALSGLSTPKLESPQPDFNSAKNKKFQDWMTAGFKKIWAKNQWGFGSASVAANMQLPNTKAKISDAQSIGQAAEIKSNISHQIAHWIANDPDMWEVYSKTNPYNQNIPQNNPSYTQKMDILNGYVKSFVQEWMQTSGHSPQAVALQMATAEEFNLDKNNIFWGAHSQSIMPQAKAILEKQRPLLRGVQRMMYEWTQSSLKDAGIEEVSGYRGMAVDGSTGWAAGMQHGDERVVDDLKLRPMSAFSTSDSTGAQFVNNGQGTHKVVMSGTFHRSQIFCTCLTGYGCSKEAEFLLLSVPGSYTVKQI